MKLDNEAPANSNHAPDSEFDYLSWTCTRCGPCWAPVNTGRADAANRRNPYGA